MTGEPEDEGDDDGSSAAEYCSLSECIVTPDSASGFEASSVAIVGVWKRMISISRAARWLITSLGRAQHHREGRDGYEGKLSANDSANRLPGLPNDGACRVAVDR